MRLVTIDNNPHVLGNFYISKNQRAGSPAQKDSINLLLRESRLSVMRAI
jgi:hypothetical protein